MTQLSSCVRLYHTTHEEARFLMQNQYYDPLRDVLAYTVLDTEVTFYLFLQPFRAAIHDVFRAHSHTDGRIYHVMDLHEDVPGIDHVGIIQRISKRFVVHGIPILYLNTYGHNLVLVSEEHHATALEILQEIAYV